MPSLIPMTRCPKQLMSDMLTRTKNPVLPSVYIDNSLIVPEPSTQKYHNPHPLLSPEDMDDYYEAFLDDKDITETLFHVWMKTRFCNFTGKKDNLNDWEQMWRDEQEKVLYFLEIFFFPAILLCIWPTYIILIAKLYMFS
jgi:hypothetical protein